MASSRRSRPSRRVSTGLVTTVAEAVATALRRGDRVSVGLSGGVDSVVLLDVLVRLASRRGWRLSALHVNHGISPNAKRWAAFCRRLCGELAVPIKVVKVSVARGDSLEAAARSARYAAFGAEAADCIALAHNRDDQAETVFLQLLRGAGVKGLAAMPRERPLQLPARRSAERGSGDGALILRPLLDVPRADILAYARRRKLQWIEDESNEDIHFARNFLRREIMPRIEERFPAYRDTLARSARHLAEAADLLDQLAAQDGAAHVRDGALDVAALDGLTPSRRANLLRWFLALHGVVMPGAERLREALRQACGARNDAQVCVDLGEAELRRHAGALHVVPKLAPVEPTFSRPWRGEARLFLPQLGGTLVMSRGRNGGLDPERLAVAPVTVRVRRGGERLRLAPDRPRRSLKNLMQEADVPAWLRGRLPLLYCGNDLVWAPGLGVDSDYQASPGRRAVRPAWRPDPPEGYTR